MAPHPRPLAELKKMMTQSFTEGYAFLENVALLAREVLFDLRDSADLTSAEVIL